MIHVVGNAAVDTVIRLDCFPRPGETVVARGAADDLGGKGANQAVVIARCGQKVRLVAAVGADAIGERIRANLAAEGVETDGLWTWPGASDRCVICVDRHGENTIVSLIDAARDFDPLAKTALERSIAPGDWVVLQGNLRASVTRACLALAKSKNATTALNPSPTFPVSDYDWSLVDLVVLNRGEALELGGRIDPIQAARALHRRWSRNRRGDAWRGGIGARLSRRDPACERLPGCRGRHGWRGRRLLRNARRGACEGTPLG